MHHLVPLLSLLFTPTSTHAYTSGPNCEKIYGEWADQKKVINGVLVKREDIPTHWCRESTNVDDRRGQNSGSGGRGWWCSYVGIGCGGSPHRFIGASAGAGIGNSNGAGALVATIQAKIDVMPSGDRFQLNVSGTHITLEPACLEALRTNAPASNPLPIFQAAAYEEASKYIRDNHTLLTSPMTVAIDVAGAPLCPKGGSTRIPQIVHVQPANR